MASLLTRPASLVQIVVGRRLAVRLRRRPGHAIDLAKPAVEIDLAAAARAERPMLGILGRLAADRTRARGTLVRHGGSARGADLERAGRQRVVGLDRDS